MLRIYLFLITFFFSACLIGVPVTIQGFLSPDDGNLMTTNNLPLEISQIKETGTVFFTSKNVNIVNGVFSFSLDVPVDQHHYSYVLNFNNCMQKTVQLPVMPYAVCSEISYDSVPIGTIIAVHPGIDLSQLKIWQACDGSPIKENSLLKAQLESSGITTVPALNSSQRFLVGSSSVQNANDLYFGNNSIEKHKHTSFTYSITHAGAHSHSIRCNTSLVYGPYWRIAVSFCNEGIYQPTLAWSGYGNVSTFDAVHNHNVTGTVGSGIKIEENSVDNTPIHFVVTYYIRVN